MSPAVLNGRLPKVVTTEHQSSATRCFPCVERILLQLFCKAKGVSWPRFCSMLPAVPDHVSLRDSESRWGLSSSQLLYFSYNPLLRCPTASYLSHRGICLRRAYLIRTCLEKERGRGARSRSAEISEAPMKMPP